MNFVGHHEIARRVGLDDAGRLGAMLPDFATMLGTRLRPDALPADVRVGVDLHHRTDAVFHAHDAVRAGMRDLTAAALDRGVGRGAARAVGHIGYEMLLDAALAAAPITTTLLAATTGDRRVDDALGRPDGWPDMRRLLATRRPRYDEPAWVAERLFEILRRRPRLTFAADRRSDVATALADASPGVHAAAPGILLDVLDAVDPRGDRPDERAFTLLG
jgi:hypothetical protein